MSDNKQGASGPITSSIESPEAWKRVVKIEIERSHFDKEYASRLKTAAKKHQKPGFRKGKTPAAVVEKEMGDMLRMDTIEALVPQAWMSAILEHKLSPITDPALENMEFGEEGPMKFDLVVEVRPEIELTDCAGIPVKKRAIEIKDKDLDEVLERLVDSRAAFEKVERAAKDGDQILLDLTPSAWDDEPDSGKKIEDQRFVLGSENNLPVFNEELVGAAAGDTRDISVAYPEDHPNENLRDQSVKFHCEIKEIAEKVKPEINDEFAATIEEGKTLAELKESITKDLTKEAERQVAQEIDQQLVAELITRNDVSLPPSMVDRYLESGLEEMHKRNTQMGKPNSEEEDEVYRTEGRPHSEKALKGMLLLEAVRIKEDIKVTEEAVDKHIEEIAAENGFDVERYKEYVNGGDEKDRMMYDLAERKAYDFLLDKAVIEDVAADTDVFAEEE